MRIVCFVGILHSRRMLRMWVNLRASLLRLYPNATFHVEQCWYWHLGVGVAHESVELAVAKYDDGEDILLVGHSVGGLLARRAAEEGRFRKSRVLGVVTINTPYHYHYALFPYFFGGRRALKVPTISFGGTRDWLVPWGTKFGDEVFHTLLPMEHQEDLIENQKLAEEIAKIAKEEFEKARR